MNFKIKFLLALALTLALSVFVYGLKPGQGRNGANKAESSASTMERAKEKTILYWYDPMYPASHFDQPGKSPFMDMDLVPRYAQDDEGEGVRVDPSQVQNLAVRTVKARRGRLTYTREIPGSVEFNGHQLAEVQPRTSGFVEKVYPLAPGDLVAAGDPIADIAVQDWSSDQSEYLLLKSQRADRKILGGVLERMRLSGMPEEMLTALDQTGRVQTRLTVRAPLAGVVTAVNVYTGMNIDKTSTVAVIRGINPVWVVADLAQADLPLLSGLTRPRVTLNAYPDRAFYALSFSLLAQADPGTRTVPLRLIMDNPETLFRPGLTASVRLRSQGEEAVLVPTSSIIDLGDEQRVIIRTAEGGFLPRLVKVAGSSRDETALSSGLETDEEVVVAGLFLIDSEANLRGALNKMRAGETEGLNFDSEVSPPEEKP